MVENQRILDLTSTVRERERSLAYFVWKTAISWGFKEIDKRDIEDIIGDAYLRAVGKLKNDPTLEIENYYAWFMRITFLTTLNALRKELNKRKIFSDEDITELMDTNFIMEKTDSELNKSFMMEAINSNLSERERYIFNQSMKGYNAAEIAESTGENAAAVRQSKSRAIKKLRALFK